jgi:integrin alpha FG-GAP repeat containing protein 1
LTYGATISGPTFRYMVTNVQDQKIIRVASQNPSSSYQLLSMPYVFDGIGRSNNYIESFNAAYTTFDNGNQVRVFTPIIPNSKLVISANSREARSWTLELFINPMEYLVLVTVAAVVVLTFLGIAIICMHLQEKREDKKTQLNIDF